MRPLERHIIDTIKEWQMKIGRGEGGMNLYYPRDALAELLELPEGEGQLSRALADFAQEIRPRLGEIRISHEGERYCLAISEKGCAYVEEEVPDAPFLRSFLAVLTGPDSSMEDVECCFAQYAKNHGGCYRVKEAHHHGLGKAFYFEWGADAGGEDQDPYVYCVEDDAFGLTYHRFTRAEYRRMEADEAECCDESCVHPDRLMRAGRQMPDEDELYALSELFKVFGDPTRIRILFVLFGAELCVCDLAEALHMTQSAISHQLRILKQARLVDSRREGKAVFYYLADDHVRTIIAQGREHIEE